MKNKKEIFNAIKSNKIELEELLEKSEFINTDLVPRFSKYNAYFKNPEVVNRLIDYAFDYLTSNTHKTYLAHNSLEILASAKCQEFMSELTKEEKPSDKSRVERVSLEKGEFVYLHKDINLEKGPSFFPYLDKIFAFVEKKTLITLGKDSYYSEMVNGEMNQDSKIP